MKCQLTLKYKFSDDGDDFGWLAAELETPAFKAMNGTWVQWQDILDLSAALACYPIETVEPATGLWGFSENEQHIEVTKIVVKPLGPSGGLRVLALLANNDEPDNLCSVSFETDYPALGKFADELTTMITNRSGSAILIGWTSVR